MKRVLGSVTFAILVAVLVQILVGFTAPGDHNWAMGDLGSVAAELEVEPNLDGQYEVAEVLRRIKNGLDQLDANLGIKLSQLERRVARMEGDRNWEIGELKDVALIVGVSPGSDGRYEVASVLYSLQEQIWSLEAALPSVQEISETVNGLSVRMDGEIFRLWEEINLLWEEIGREINDLWDELNRL